MKEIFKDIIQDKSTGETIDIKVLETTYTESETRTRVHLLLDDSTIEVFFMIIQMTWLSMKTY